MILRSVMYHYVRNPEQTEYPGIKAVSESDFVKQVDLLKTHYEIGTLEVMLDFLAGRYVPKKNICVLTFDDGLKEHAKFVTEVLSDRNIEGMFFVPTACIEEYKVLPVHQNHFLLGSLDFSYYQNHFLDFLAEDFPNVDISIDDSLVEKTYRWDTLEVARFKYLINYKLERNVRNSILQKVFNQELGSEESFAKSLYVSWEEIRNMQDAGMCIGGHSHTHQVLSHLSEEEQRIEIRSSSKLLKTRMSSQHYYPFSYPFGKPSTFSDHTIKLLKEYEFCCAFCTVPEDTKPLHNIFSINRIDPKDITC